MASPLPHPGPTQDRPSAAAGASSHSPLHGLEDALSHQFEDRVLLVQALTHRSLAYEQAPPDPALGETVREDNERLEFLGDAVVGLVTAESLYRRYPDLPEGALTRLRGALVSRRHLAEVAESLELGKHLRLGRGEERSGGRNKRALLANAMEAVIGALFLDGGLKAAQRVIETRVLAPSVASLRDQLLAGEGIGDFKSALQELLQARKQGQPEYRTTGESGPDHRKQFFVEAWSGGASLAEGSGPTRKIAEQDAARRAMERLRSARENP